MLLELEELLQRPALHTPKRMKIAQRKEINYRAQSGLQLLSNVSGDFVLCHLASAQPPSHIAPMQFPSAWPQDDRD